jgi:hypothetical protein
LENAEPGKRAISPQKYKIKQGIADLDRVALEVEWVETLAVPFPRELIRQRNYDCYEP